MNTKKNIRDARAHARMGRKVLSIVLALALVFTMFSFTAFADTGEEPVVEPQGNGEVTTEETEGEVDTTLATISFDAPHATISAYGSDLSHKDKITVAKDADFYFDLTLETGYTLSSIVVYNTVSGDSVAAFSQGGSSYYIPAEFVTDNLEIIVESDKDEVEDEVVALGDIGVLSETRINANWDYITTNDELGEATNTPTAFARVYTTTGYEDVLENYPSVTYVEFGNALSFVGSTNRKEININATRASLVINARNYIFEPYSSSSNVYTLRVGESSANSSQATTLQKVTLRKFNVPDSKNRYGLITINSASVKEVEFDGLIYTGPQLSYAPARSGNIPDYVFNGETNPVTINHTPNGVTVYEFLNYVKSTYFVGNVTYSKWGSVTRSHRILADNTGDVVVGAKPTTPGTTNLTNVPNTNVQMTNATASAFIQNAANFTVADGASFTYKNSWTNSSNTGANFSSTDLKSLTVGVNSTFDVTMTGNTNSTQSSVRSSGDIVVKNGATFKIQSLNRTNATYAALLANGNVSIDNPKELLIYSSGQGNAVIFASGKSFTYKGNQLATWTNRYTPALPTNWDAPTKNWLSTDSNGFTISATTTGTAGNFGSLNYSGGVEGIYYNGTTTSPGYALNASNFSWSGQRLISNLRIEMVPYTIKYIDGETGLLLDNSLFESGYTNTVTGNAYSNIGLRVDYPEIEKYIRAGGQPTSVFPSIDPNYNNFVIYYVPGSVDPGPPGVSKVARAVGQNEWEVTLTVTGKNEEFSPMTHLDMMIVLDLSGSMDSTVSGTDKTRIDMCTEATVKLLDNLASDNPVTGDLRVGLVTFASAANTRTVFTLTPIEQVAELRAYVNGLDASDTGTGTNYEAGIRAAETELYSNPLTYRADTQKYMVFMSDGQRNAGWSVTEIGNQCNRLKAKGLKIITISMFENVAVLNSMQNVGYYQPNDDAGFTAAIQAIQETLKASALATGIVTDPMGPNFEIVPLGSGGVDLARDVTLAGTPNGGTVTMTHTNPQTLRWVLSPDTSTASMTYRVKMKDITNPNFGYDTNGDTTLVYTNTNNPEDQTINFDVPTVQYEKSYLNVSYAGELPATYPLPATYESETYGSPRFEFAGPQDLQYHAVVKVTYNGVDYATWNDFALANNVQNGSTAGMFTIPADFAETRSLVYTYTKTTINLPVDDIEVNDLEITYGDTLPAAYGITGWPVGMPTEPFNFNYYQSTNAVDAGTYADELCLEITVKPEYVGQYLVTGQTKPGQLKINPKPVVDDVSIVVTGHNLGYTGSPQTVVSAVAGDGAQGTISYKDPTSGAWVESTTYTAKDVGSYTVQFRIVGTGNYTGTAYGTATGTIGQATFPDVSMVLDWEGYQELTYNEQEQIVAYAKIKQNTDYTGTLYWTTDDPAQVASPNWQTGSSSLGANRIDHKQINAGTYHVWFKLVGSGNYAGAEVTTPRVTGIIEPAEYDGALAALGLQTTYNGSTQLVGDASVVSGSNFTGNFSYSVTGAAPWTPGNQYFGKDVGEYPVTFRLIGHTNYKGTHTMKVTGTILPADLPQGALVAEGYNRTYNGQAQVVADASIYTPSDFEGTIQYTLDTNAYAPDAVWITANEYKATENGSYTVTFRLQGTGNYATNSYVYKEVTGSIGKNPLPTDWRLVFDANGITTTYTGMPQTIANAVAKSPYTGTFEYQVNNDNIWRDGSSFTATEAGTYPVKFRFTANGNYTGTVAMNEPVNGVITPLNINTLNPADVFTVTGYTRTLNNQPQVVVSAEVKDAKFTGDFTYATNSSLNDFSNQGSSYSQTSVGTYPAMFRFTATGNYTGTLDQLGTGYIELPKVGDVLETTFDKDLVYNGMPQTLGTFKVIDMDPAWTGTVTYSINGAAPVTGSISELNSIKATDPGTYNITIIATGTGDWSTKHQTVYETVVIAKKPVGPDPDMFFSVQTKSPVYNGLPQEIALATLINGTEGTFTYTITDEKGNTVNGNGPSVSATDAGTYTIVYTLTGTGFYTGQISKTVTATISKQTITTDPAHFSAVGYQNLTYDGTVKTVAEATMGTGVTGDIYYLPQGQTIWTKDTLYKQTNAGTYPVTFKLIGSGNYTGEAEITVTGIIKAAAFPPEYNNALVATPYEHIYSGLPQQIASAERSQSYYTGTIQYTTNVNWQTDPFVQWTTGNSIMATDVAEYPVAFRLVGSGNYEGSIAYATATGKITPKDYGDDILIASGQTKVYNGELQTIAVASVAPGVDFKGLIEYSIDGGVNWIVGSEFKQRDAKDYVAMFRITGQGGNYQGVYHAQTTCSITQAQIPGDWTKVFAASGYTYTYDGDEKDVAKAWITDTTKYTGNFQYSVDNGVTWASTNGGDVYKAINAGNYDVLFRLTATGNYTGIVAMDKAVRGTINPAYVPQDPDLVFSTQGFTSTYDGTAKDITKATPKSPYQGTFEYSVDNGPWTAGDTATAINAKSYNVHYRFTASGNYQGTVISTSPTVGTINPANINTLDPKAVFTVTPYTRGYTGNSQVVASAAVNDLKYEGSFSYRAANDFLTGFKQGSSYSETDPGVYNATFRFTATGNYTGYLDQDTQGKIEKPDPGAVFESFFESNVTYTGLPQTLATAQVLPTNPAWTGTFTYSINGGAPVNCSLTDLNSVKATDVGTYNITFTATGSGAFSGINQLVTKTVTISKKPVGPDPDPFFTAVGHDRTYTGLPQVVATATLVDDVTGTFTYTISGPNGFYEAGNGNAAESNAVRATNAGTYSITYTLTGTGSYEGQVSKTITAKISPKPIDPTDPDAYLDAVGYTNLVFDNTLKVVAEGAPKPGVSGDIYYLPKDESIWTKATQYKQTNAGTYEVTFKIIGTGNYQGEAEKTVTGIISPATFPPGDGAVIKATPYTRTYNGSPQIVATAAVTQSQYTGLIQYTTDETWRTNPAAAWISAESYSATNKGTYPVAFRLVGSGNYAGSIAYDSTTGIVLPYTPPVEDEPVLIATGETKVYNGQAQTIATARIAPGVDFDGIIEYTLDGGTNWIAGAEFKQTDAKKYVASFRVRGTGNYSGTYNATANCEITQAQIPSDWTKVFTAQGLTATYDGSEKNIGKATIIDTNEYQGNFQYSLDNGITWEDGDVATAINAGDYDILFRLTATGNYTGTVKMDAPVRGVINPATIPTDPTLVFDTQGFTSTYDGTTKVITRATPRSPYQGTFEYSIDGGAWMPGSEATAINAKTYKVHYRFTATGNYTGSVQTVNPVEGTINPININTLDPKAVFTVFPYTKIYNSSSQVVAEAKVNDAKYTGDFSYRTSWLGGYTNGAQYSQTEPGDYPVTFMFTGTGNYTGSLTQDTQGKITPFDPGEVLETAFSSGLIYNEAPQLLATAKVKDMAPNPQWTGTVRYSVNGTWYDGSATAENKIYGTEAGDYIITIVATGTGASAGINDTVTQTVTIGKKNVGEDPEAAFSLTPYDRVFNGSSQMIGEAKLVDGTTGTFAYNVVSSSGDNDSSGTTATASAVNVDTYTITYVLTGTGNYTGTATQTKTAKITPYTINTNEPGFTAEGYTDLIFKEGTEQVVALATPNPGVTGDFTYTINGDDGVGRQAKATDAGDYTIVYTMTGTGNYTGTASVTVQGKISPQTLPPGEGATIVAVGYTQTFNGSEQMVASAAFADGKTFTGDFFYSTDQNAQYNPSASWAPGSVYNQTAVGNYPVTFKFIANGNYTGTAYASATGIINPKTVTGGILETSYSTVVYSGSAQTISTAKIKDGVDFDGIIEYKTPGGSWVEGTEYKEINAGDYPVEWRLTGTGNYSGVHTDNDVAHITPKPFDPTDPTKYMKLTGYTDLIYNEANQTVGFAELVGDTQGDFDFRVVGVKGTDTTGSGDTAQAKNADDYTITFTLTGTGNYSGTVSDSVTGKIKPKPFDPTDPTLYMELTGYSKVYNSNLQVVADAKYKPGTDVTGDFAWSTDDGTTWNAGSIFNAKNVGEYEVTFKLTGTGNYEGEITDVVTGEITKAKLPDDPTKVIKVVGHTQTYNSNPQTVVSASIVEGTDYSGKIEYTTDALPWSPTAKWIDAKEYKETNVGSYPATFRLVADGNYSGTVYGNATGTINEKELPPSPVGVIEVTGYNLEYNSAQQVVVEAKIADGTDYEGDFSYSTDSGITWTDGNKFMAKDVGTYTVMFKLTGTGNYKGEVTDSDTGSIYQKDLPIDDPEGVIDARGLTVEYNSALQTIATAKIKDGTDFEGTLYYSVYPDTWVQASEFQAINAGSYPVTFKLVGSGNYKGEVSVNVTGTITEKELPTDPTGVLTGLGYTQTYDGTAQMVARAAIETGTDYQGTLSYTTESVIMPWTTWTAGEIYSETEVGDYPVTFRLTGTGNYKGTVDLKITDGKIVAAERVGDLEVSRFTKTYDDGNELVIASAKVADTAPADYTGKIEYSVDGGTTWVEASEFKATDVGTYDVTFRLTGTQNYSGVDEKTVQGEIVAKGIDPTDPDLYMTASGWNEVYTGSPVTIANAAPAAGSIVTGDIDYSIDGATWMPASEYQETNVGTYPVTFRFTANGNYSGFVTKDVTGSISQGDLPVDPTLVFTATGYTKVFNNTAQVVADAKIKEGTDYTGDFSYSIDSGTTWIAGSEYKETDANTYPVQFKFVANGNYKGELYANAEGKITRADLPQELGQVLVANNYTNTYDGSNLLVADAFVTDPTLYQGVISYTTDNPLSPSAVWYVANEYREIPVGEYPVTFRFAASGNYTGVVYTTAKGTINAALLGGNVNDYMSVRGYTNQWSGSEQVVASASYVNNAGVVGTIEKTTDGINWTTNLSHTGQNVGSYPVTYRFTATGNHTGVFYASTTGTITPKPADPVQPIIINPPDVTVYPGGGSTTVIEMPAETTATETATVVDTTRDDDDDTTLPEPNVPLGNTEVESDKAWSLINLIIAAITAIFSVVILGVAILMRRRNQNADEGDAEAQQSTRYRSTSASKVLGIIAGVLGLLPLVAFFLLEDFTALPAVGVNANTPLIAVLALLFLVMFVVYFIVRNRDKKVDRLENQDDGSNVTNQGAPA